jgi:hypothetical protein
MGCSRRSAASVRSAFSTGHPRTGQLTFPLEHISRFMREPVALKHRRMKSVPPTGAPIIPLRPRCEVTSKDLSDRDYPAAQ